jgi:rubrerythrin
VAANELTSESAAMKHWTLDQIPWASFDPTKVDPEIVKVIKAASVVEYNGADYADYLCRVFDDSPEFQTLIRNWAREEVQHGAALARWAKLADPDFDFDLSFKRFTEGYKAPLDASASVRGTRSGELVARCIVETGTSSYYAALNEATDEPVLKQICRNIAADELRHYKLFYAHLDRYLAQERLGAWGRLKVAGARIFESEDDELAYAYFAANHPREIYQRRKYSRAYARRAYGYYRRHHVERGIAMVLKVVGLSPTGRLNRFLSRAAFWFLESRARRLAAANA